MQTERLYYQDPTIRRFTARIVGRQTLGGRPAVTLDRTAFYPTGGGQPHDLGYLDDIAVTEVIAEGAAVWHCLAEELASAEVTGQLDWPRRFDHMQQHTGQHILSQAFVQECNAETVAFHLGAAASTIDLSRIDLTLDQLAAAEAAANAVLDAALPVTAAFMEQAAVAALPLRKPTKVTEAIRIVQVAGFDWSACGGTHVANTAQVGLIKITGTERRGAELRVTFLCGGRARRDYARLQTLAQGLVGRFTTAQDELLDAVDRRAAEMAALRRELADLEAAWVESTAAALWTAAPTHDGRRVVALVSDAPLERTRKVAQVLRGRSGAVALLGVRGERPQLICTRADDVPLDAGALLRVAVAAGGGRGGGRPDWAQGGVPTDAALAAALAAGQVEIARLLAPSKT